jgi:VWFA-related protein
MIGMRRLIASLSCALVLCGPSVRTQDLDQRRFVERVDVPRLIVDARVVDDRGNPVLGLTADDFRVKIAGKTARVESAFWVGGNALGGDYVPLAAAQPGGTPSLSPVGRLIVFVFQKDLEPSRIIGLMRMLIEAQGFLQSLTPADRVAILSFDSHLKIWVDFTNDHERLRRILDRGILFEHPPQVEETASVSLVARLGSAVGRRTYSIEKGLQLIGEALEPLPGSKSIVLVGHGFGRFGAGGVRMEPGYGPARDALLAARAAVFSLDVTNADYHSLEAGLQLVSTQTGGFFARTHIFTSQAMTRLAGALAGYYALFVEKPDAGRGRHEIDVALTGRKGTVLARSSFTQE